VNQFVNPKKGNVMKKLIITSMMMITLFQSAYACRVYVKSYVRSDGTVVSAHVRSCPDGIKSNNLGYRG